MRVETAAAPLTSSAVCRLTGVTYRQLNYWVHTGIVSPSIQFSRGSGSYFRWSIEDVERVQLVGLIMRWAMSVGHRSRIARRVAQEVADMLTGVGYLVVGSDASVSYPGRVLGA